MKIKRISWLLWVIMVSFMSCEDEENNVETPPVLDLLKNGNYIHSDSSFKAGDKMSFYFMAQKGTENITNFRALLKTDSGTETVFDTGVNTASLQFEKAFTKSFAETEEWTFIVRDKNLIESSVSLIIELDSGAVFDEVKTFEKVVLRAQNHNSSPQCFFSLERDSAYTLEEAFARQEVIDLVYFYGVDENTLASPGANIETEVFQSSPTQYQLDNWTVKNTVRYKPVSLSQSEFEDIETDSALFALYGSSDGKRKAKNLQAGDTHSFKTESGKLGVFRVNAVSGTEAGELNISIKLQK